MRMLSYVAVALALLAAAFAVYVRLAASDPDVWHVDPLSAPPTGSPNSWRVGPQDGGGQQVDAVAPVFAVPAESLAAEFAAFARMEPRTSLLREDADGLAATYVQRSRLMGYPDYISVRFIDLGDGRSTLAIFSRSRFGSSDFGVNRARVEAWLAELPAPRA